MFIKKGVCENKNLTLFCFSYSIWKVYIGFPILMCMFLNNTWMFKGWMKHFTYTVLHQGEQCTQPLDSIYYSLNWSYWVSPAASKWVSPQRVGWEWGPAALELHLYCCAIYFLQFPQCIIVNCISQSAAHWALVPVNHYCLLWKQGRSTCHDLTGPQSVPIKLGCRGLAQVSPPAFTCLCCGKHLNVLRPLTAVVSSILIKA